MLNPIFTLDARAVVNVSRHTSNDTTRPQLDRVLLEESGTLVATNGHSLIAWRNASVSPDDAPVTPQATGYTIAIPPAVLKACKHKSARAVTFDVAGQMATILRERGGIGERIFLDANTIDTAADYPLWRRVLPPTGDDAPQLPPALDTELLGAFTLTPDYGSQARHFPTWTPCGNRAGIIRYARTSDVFGLLMPLAPAVTADERTVPIWATGTPATEQAAA